MPNSYTLGEPIDLYGYFATAVTIGQINADSAILNCQDASGYTTGDPLIIFGAGVAGGDLLASVSTIVGNVVTLSQPAGTGVIRAKVGKLVVPTTVTVIVLQPDGTEITLTPIPITTGRYKATFTSTQAGTHRTRYEGAGAYVAQAESMFYVNERRVP